MLPRSTANGITSTYETRSTEKTDEVKTTKRPRYPLFSLKSTRLRICMMLASGLFVTAAMRLDLSMAIVCMVNSTAFATNSRDKAILSSAKASSRCQPLNRDYESAIQAGYTGDFMWSPAMQSVLLSATFYGGLATISFAGVLADKYGPKTIFVVVTSDYIIVTLLSPLLGSLVFLCIFRFQNYHGNRRGWHIILIFLINPAVTL
ncbi:hypothetical protein COOONC_06488 [Cooperia oncophora]